MRTVTILGVYDLTSRAVNIDRQNAAFDAAGYQPGRRKIYFADADNFLGPQTNGILDTRRNAWRNKSIRITNNGVIEFDGIIKQVGRVNAPGGNGVLAWVEAVTGLGAAVGFPISEYDPIYATVSSAQAAGNRIIPLESASALPDDTCFVSFNNYLQPSYLVTDINGTTTAMSVGLDRGLEAPVADAVGAIILAPRIDTPANLAKRALQNNLANVDRLDLLDGDSFDRLSDAQAALGLYLWTIVRPEQRISATQYINTICAATGMFVSESESGLISVANGPGYSGKNPRKSVTDARILFADQEEIYAPSDYGFYYGYSCVYRVDDTVGVQSRALGPDSDRVIDYGPTAVFKPFELTGANLSAYWMMYADQPTAEYYGERILEYYSVHRKRVKLSLARRANDLSDFPLRQFEELTLTTTAGGLDYTNEPVRVMSYNYSEAENRYTEVVLELHNQISPGLTNPA